MYVGIDVGGTNLKAGLVDGEGRLRASLSRPVGDFPGAEGFAAALASLAAEAAQKGGTDVREVTSVGIGIPGAVEGGTVVYTCNLPLRDVPLSDLFRRHLDVPVLLGNDADCAAVGEWLMGAGRGMSDLLAITLGTGVGGGLILNGKLYTGGGMVGEVGHMAVEKDGVLCSCGRRGCWEAYASATGLIRMTKEAMASDAGSMLHIIAGETGTVEGRTAFQAAERGDETALAVCRRYVAYLALGVTNLVNILQPQAVVLGGGVAAAPEHLLLTPLREAVEAECYSRHVGRTPRILRAELGNDAGIIGAALLERAI